MRVERPSSVRTPVVRGGDAGLPGLIDPESRPILNGEPIAGLQI